MVIQPSMLPRSTYGSSLRTVIDPDGWQRLRRAAGRTTGGACAWCGEVTLLPLTEIPQCCSAKFLTLPGG